MTAGVRDKPASRLAGCIHMSFVSLGCGTYFNKVEYSTVQHSIIVIIYDNNSSIIVPYNNTVELIV